MDAGEEGGEKTSVSKKKMHASKNGKFSYLCEVSCSAQYIRRKKKKKKKSIQGKRKIQ